MFLTMTLTRSKKRKKLLLAEVARYKEVIAHPAFKADPWGALMEHIRNTVTIPAERRRAEEEAAAKEDERRAKKKKGKQRAAAADDGMEDDGDGDGGGERRPKKGRRAPPSASEVT